MKGYLYKSSPGTAPLLSFYFLIKTCKVVSMLPSGKTNDKTSTKKYGEQKAHCDTNEKELLLAFPATTNRELNEAH